LAAALLLGTVLVLDACAGPAAAPNAGPPASAPAAAATLDQSLPTSPPLTGQPPTVGVVPGILPRAHALGTPLLPTQSPVCQGFTLTAALFDDNAPALGPDSGAALDEVARQLKAVGGAITIVGYTDARPTTFPGGNQALSDARADSVRDALESRGVTNIVDVEGRGAADPVDLGTTQVAYSRNRRVEVTFDCQP
jgi:outer membrane protein OmpA-like peptidoglycan-associated protein